MFGRFAKRPYYKKNAPRKSLDLRGAAVLEKKRAAWKWAVRRPQR